MRMTIMKITIRLAIIIIFIGVVYLGITYLFNGRKVLTQNPVTLGANLYQQRVLVVSPHQDDEIIGCAGVIKRYIDRGADIRVMYVTNGDLQNLQKQRIEESISALKLLGLSKDKIIYLGYGDWSLLGLYCFENEPDRVLPSNNNSRTLSFPGLGIYSYHRQRYGAEAEYTRRNITDDIYNVLLEFQPEEIFIPAQLENHQDHSGSAFFTIESIIRVQQSLDYHPVTYEYMLYSGYVANDLWLPALNCDPTQPVTNQNLDIDNYIPYSWFRRASFAAPPRMTAPFTPVWPDHKPKTPSENIKYNAMHKFESQLQDDYWMFERFIRSNEVFWKRRIASLSYGATVTASSEDTSKNQICGNVSDGIFVGELKAPFDGWNNYFKNLEWAVSGPSPEPWVQLTWQNPITANQIRLYDRPNFNDNVLAGSLHFSDGTTIKIGRLNPNGTGSVIHFPLKTFSWVKFTIDSFEGNNPGLSEFEVYDTRDNIAPAAIVTSSSQNPSQLAVKAVDQVVDGYPKNSSKEWATAGQKAGAWIQLDWPQTYIVTKVILYDRVNLGSQVTSGKLIFSDGTSLEVGALNDNGEGLTVEVPEKATKSVRFEITEFAGGAAGLAELEVYGYPLQLRDDYFNIASTARITASSEKSGLNRFMAVDGVRSGAPCDRGFEWVSGGSNQGNPWIQLNWERTYNIKRVVLYDRPNPNEQILGGRIYFNDGSDLAVGSLPNDGSGYSVEIPGGRNIKSLRFEITKAAGRNIGLSEIEVYGSPGAKIDVMNQSSHITSSPVRTGPAINCFDGREDTVYTSSQKSCMIQVDFPNPVSVARIRALIGESGSSKNQYDWWVEAADQVADFNSKSGSYVKVGETRYDISGFWDQIFINDYPAGKKIWRFWARKKTGDDFTTITELELWGE